MSRNICPCKDCPDRWVDTETLTRCHSTCKRHAEWQEAIRARRAKERAENIENYKIVEHFKSLKKKLRK